MARKGLDRRQLNKHCSRGIPIDRVRNRRRCISRDSESNGAASGPDQGPIRHRLCLSTAVTKVVTVVITTQGAAELRREKSPSCRSGGSQGGERWLARTHRNSES